VALPGFKKSRSVCALRACPPTGSRLRKGFAKRWRDAAFVQEAEKMGSKSRP